jgi:hypothetical protein
MHEQIVGNEDMDIPIEQVHGMEVFLLGRNLSRFCRSNNMADRGVKPADNRSYWSGYQF